MSESDQSTFSDEDFKECMERALVILRDTMQANVVQVVTPVAFVHIFPQRERDKPNQIVTMSDFDFEHRRLILNALGQVYGGRGDLLKCMIFVTEMWMAVLPESELNSQISVMDLPNKQHKICAMDLPNKQHKICAMGMSVDGRIAVAAMEMLGDRDTRIHGGAIEHFPIAPQGEGESICESFYAGYRTALESYLRNKPKLSNPFGPRPKMRPFSLN